MFPLQRYRLSLALLTLGLGTLSAATITVGVDRPGAAINPAMWGAFFEDINFGADGGLYAELVKNRGFEFPDPWMSWIQLHPANAQGTWEVRTDAPFNARNPHYVRIASTGPAPFGLGNEGFRGIALRRGEPYRFSLRVRSQTPDAIVRVQLYGGDGAVLATGELKDLAPGWTERSLELTPVDTDAHGWLAVLLPAPATVDVDFVSLFPVHTWKNRPGGLRADMVQALADLHPGFLRFPGGCIVEGRVLAQRYQWKATLGPVEERPTMINRWNNEFLHRPTPDYYQDFGLGFFEYFQLCEDIGASPLPILNCGMACQFNSGELCPPDALQTYIQDALDLIEFANGGPDTTWGAKRVALGHPAPFHLRMLGVGNEQWGTDYFERFAAFAKVLKARHPEIELVAAAGPSPDDDRFKAAWAKLPALGANIVDEHCYAPPAWFLDAAHRYDTYSRSGPNVFMGEYAAQSVDTVNVKNRNTYGCALAEAAFMTGLERNADVVRMASYAPLFANRDAWQWTPDLIWVDGLNVVRTPNYEVQRLFATNRGDRILPVTLADVPANDANRVYASATMDDASRTVIVKLVNATSHAVDSTLALTGVANVMHGTETNLHADDLAAENTFDHPTNVKPQTRALVPGASSFNLSVPAQTFTVLRLQVR